MPKPLTLVDQYRALLATQDEAAQAQMVAAWSRVEAALRSPVTALVLAVEARRNEGNTVTASTIVGMDLYFALLAQFRALLDQYVATIAAPLITAMQEQWVPLAVEHMGNIVDAAGSTAAIGGAAATDLIGRASNGAPLREVLRDKSYLAGATAMASVTSQARGAASSVTQQVLRQGAALALTGFLGVLTTETYSAYRESARRVMADSGVVEGYQRRSRRDDRVCPGCISADGDILGLERFFLRHPHCRCYPVPVVIGKELIQTDRGRDWFDKQPRETQAQIMGPGRMAYLDSGGAWARLGVVRENAEFGGAIVPRNVGEL